MTRPHVDYSVAGCHCRPCESLYKKACRKMAAKAQTPKPSLRERCVKRIKATRLDIWDIFVNDLEAFAKEIEAEAYQRGLDRAAAWVKGFYGSDWSVDQIRALKEKS